jgi:hypothetical protein
MNHLAIAIRHLPRLVARSIRAGIAIRVRIWGDRDIDRSKSTGGIDCRKTGG